MVDLKFQQTTPAEALVDETFRALSKGSNTNTNKDGSTIGGNDNNVDVNGDNEKPTGIEGGNSSTRAAIKELASSLKKSSVFLATV